MSIKLLIAILSIVGCANAQTRVPPPLEPKSCEENAPPNELPNTRFARKGGLTTQAKVRYRNQVLTVDGVEQGRDLRGYETLTLTNPKPRTVVESEGDPMFATARTFLWEHWRDQKQGYLILTASSVDAMSTSHVFVEHDDSGRWRVSWRIVRHNDRIDDLPTDYGTEWVNPAGFRQPGKPLASGTEPDPTQHRLEFRDKCGEISHSF